MAGLQVTQSRPHGRGLVRHLAQRFLEGRRGVGGNRLGLDCRQIDGFQAAAAAHRFPKQGQKGGILQEQQTTGGIVAGLAEGEMQGVGGSHRVQAHNACLPR